MDEARIMCIFVNPGACNIMDDSEYYYASPLLMRCY